MADLRVKGEWVGPGEKKTADRLRDELPSDWVIFAGRKLAGENRDDVDLIIVGKSKIFLLDEKAWGPRLVVDDTYWYVNDSPRPNPLGRVAQLARKLATKLKDHAQGYKNVPGKRVVPGIVLSNDNLQLFSGTKHDVSEHLWTLAEASAEMMKLDAGDKHIGIPRASVIQYLDDLPAGGKVPTLGDYKVDSRIDVPGIEQAYVGLDSGGQTVVLKCYPINRLEELGDPHTFLQRETKALNKLADTSRSWRALPFFRDDAYGLFVVPVVPPKNARNLTKSLSDLDPERPDGRLPEQIASKVMLDAFGALAEVHEEGLVHRALHPSRIWLGRAMRVMFSDFHLARIEGAATISLWEPDGDISEDYRAPECAASVGVATPKSDVFSLTMCLIEWLLGVRAPDHTIDELQTMVAQGYPWAAPLLDGLQPVAERPSAEEMAVKLEPAAAPPVPAGDALPNDDFREGGLVGGRYRVIKQLGEGGFAVSWKVFDTQVEHHKVLKQFKHLVPENLRYEYAAANQLSSDFCGKVYDVQFNHDPAYLVSEYVEGQSLHVGGIDRSVTELRAIAENVLTALSYIHSKDLVHGDVTPANIVAANDGSGKAKLIDFGLAVPAGQRPAGWTPKFAAPELIAGKPSTPASDLFGCAVSLLFAMLGREITRREDDQVVIAGPSDNELTVWGDDGSALVKALLTGVSLDPADRPLSAEAFLTIVKASQVKQTPDPKARHEPSDLTEVINENVSSIRRLYRGSVAGNAGNRGLDDEFARLTYVPTMLDTVLLPRVLAGELDIVLLSGNPGDGKTSVLVQLGDQLRGAGATVEHEDEAGWRLRFRGRLFIAVYDASESHGGLSSDDLVRQALNPVAQGEPATALIAVNDGRLLQFFDDNEHLYEEWAFEVRDQLDGKSSTGARLALVDLKRRSLASLDGDSGLARKVLDILVADNLWSACDGCVAKSDCPILANRTALAGPGAIAFDELMLISHLRRRRRATFRDVRSAIAWLITGDRACEDVHQWRSAGRRALHMDRATVSELAFSDDSNDYLVAEWSELDPAQVPAPGADRIFRTHSESDDPLFENVASIARGIYFGLVLDSAGTTDRSSVSSYRYLDEFMHMLRNEDPVATRDRLLLGISRLIGAYGYTEPGLAMSSGMPGSSWAVLHTVPTGEFRVIVDSVSLPYIETIADRLTMSHSSKPSLTLTLDTAEVILRSADGELVNDLASDAILQEIDAFVSQLGRRPSLEARIVDPSGSVAVAHVDGTKIVLENA